jgi:hypothetical protein
MNDGLVPNGSYADCPGCANSLVLPLLAATRHRKYQDLCTSKFSLDRKAHHPRRLTASAVIASRGIPTRRARTVSPPNPSKPLCRVTRCPAPGVRRIMRRTERISRPLKTLAYIGGGSRPQVDHRLGRLRRHPDVQTARLAPLVNHQPIERRDRPIP